MIGADALVKSLEADACYAVGYNKVIKTAAVHKQILTDFGKVFGKLYLSKAAASVKCQVADACNAVGNG